INKLHVYFIVVRATALSLSLMFVMAPSPMALAAQPAGAKWVAPKYVFFFLSDGGGIPHMEVTRQYNRAVHNEGLIITDRIIKEGTFGLLTTHAADSLTTDSAAAATALSGGCKANIGALGICADGRTPKTVMERAREKGFRAALATTSTVYDASPAAFVAHVSNRKHFDAILDQYLRAAPDVVLGGGREYFLAKGKPESARHDGKDRLAEFAARGYAYA